MKEYIKKNEIIIRVCFWSTTGGAQLVETNIKCFCQPLVQLQPLVQSLIQVCMYGYICI